MFCIRVGAVCGLALLFGVASAQAQNEQNTGLDQAITSVDGNLKRNLEKDENHPSQKGLIPALEQLNDNKKRIGEQRAETGAPEAVGAQRVERTGRPDFAQRPAGAERPQLPERATRFGK